jgi:hypothetical protein
MPLVFPLPPLSTKAAHTLSLFFTSSYVGSIYVSKNARISFRSSTSIARGGHIPQRTFEERGRDDSDVIKARLFAVCVSTFLSCTSVFWLMWHVIGDDLGVCVISLFHDRSSLSVSSEFSCRIRNYFRSSRTHPIWRSFCLSTYRDTHLIPGAIICYIFVWETAISVPVVVKERFVPSVIYLDRCEESYFRSSDRRAGLPCMCVGCISPRRILNIQNDILISTLLWTW